MKLSHWHLVILASLSPLFCSAAEDGKALYHGAAACFTCHQADGKGLPGVIPPLFKSGWVSDNEDRLIRIVLHGLSGPIRVEKRDYNALMPPHAQLTDEQVAAVLTYVRSNFGNNAKAITTEQVAKVRAEKGAPAQPWTTKALLKKHPFGKRHRNKNGMPPPPPKDDPAAMAEIKEITMRRLWVPGATPAAIAVAYPGPQYIIWDAGSCSFRYVWSDHGFLHYAKTHWSSNGKPVAKILGKAYFTTPSDAPIRFGAADAPATTPDYTGYKLIDRNPHFLYKLGDTAIEEWFEPTADKKGLQWHVKATRAPADIFITVGTMQAANITTNCGTLETGILRASAADAAKGITITLTPMVTTATEVQQ